MKNYKNMAEIELVRLPKFLKRYSGTNLDINKGYDGLMSIVRMIARGKTPPRKR